MASIASIAQHREQHGGGGHERDALRAALAAHAAAKKNALCHRAAVDRARGLVAAAERKVARAARGVEEAKVGHALKSTAKCTSGTCSRLTDSLTDGAR
jgi:hypothetical protein